MKQYQTLYRRCILNFYFHFIQILLYVNFIKTKPTLPKCHSIYNLYINQCINKHQKQKMQIFLFKCYSLIYMLTVAYQINSNWELGILSLFFIAYVEYIWYNITQLCMIMSLQTRTFYHLIRCVPLCTNLLHCD